MYDFDSARVQMVDSQLRPNEVTDHRVIQAFLETPREPFVGITAPTLAYMDEDLRIGTDSAGNARFLLEPRIIGRLVQASDARQGSSVLVIGCATGYSAAIFAALSDSVIALESDATLAAQATEVLADLDVQSVAVIEGDHAAGYPEQAPYDIIFIDGSVPEVPDALLGQLEDGGRLITVEGEGPYGKAVRYLNEGPAVVRQVLFDAAAPVLPGFVKETAFVF